MEYLGKIISSEGLRPSPKKVEAILKVAPPTDISELRSEWSITTDGSSSVSLI